MASNRKPPDPVLGGVDDHPHRVEGLEWEVGVVGHTNSVTLPLLIDIYIS